MTDPASWNFADIWEIIAAIQSDAPALGKVDSRRLRQGAVDHVVAEAS